MSTSVSFIILGGNPAYLLHGEIPAGIEQVFGATFLKASNRWVLPAFRPVHERPLDDLQKVVAREKRVLTIDDSVREYLAKVSDFEPLPSDFEYITAPFAHQKAGLEWAYNLPRAGLFFDPGLGKCKITVDLYRLTKLPMLILCPAVVLRTWAREFITHGKITDTVIIEGSKKQKLERVQAAQKNPPAALIVTYETATTLIQELLKVPYKNLILDESHRAKEISSVRTRAAIMLSEGRPRRVLLSGTPTLGNPFSMYAQFKVLGHYFAPESWPTFKEKFATFKAGSEHQVVGYRNMEILNERVNELCMRKKQEECLDLPDIRVVDVPFDVSAEQKALYNLVATQGGDPLGAAEGYAALHGVLTGEDGTTRPEPYVFARETVSRLNKVEQIIGGFVNKTQMNLGLCNGCKHLDRCIEDNVRAYSPGCLVAGPMLPVVHRFKDDARRDTCKELLQDLLANPENKVIIWTRFLMELEAVREIAEELGIGFSLVKGGMGIDAFEGAMHSFNTDPNCRIYAGQVASGIGVTLNAANYTIYYSLPWSHEHYVQSKARNYRIGQRRKVTVFRLLALGTTDFRKAAVLDQKIEIEDMLTREEYNAECPRHSRGAPQPGPCNCGGNIERILATILPIP